MKNEIHFDYLSLTLHPKREKKASFQYVAGILTMLLQEDYIERDFGLRGYAARLEFATSGTLVLYGGEHQRDTINIVIPGDACRILGIRGLLEISELDKHYDIVCTRLDIALDKSGVSFQRTLADIADYITSPYVARWKVIRSGGFDRDAFGRRQVIDSQTTYIGSRQSLRMLRVYGKVDDNDEPYTRCELEIKKEPAQALWLAFVAGAGIHDLAVTAFAGFFDAEMFLDTHINGLMIPVEFSDRAKVKHTLVWYLSLTRSITALWDFYGHSNVDNMIKAHQRDLEQVLAKKKAASQRLRRKIVGNGTKAPVGDTGATNFDWSAKDKQYITFEDYFAHLKGFVELDD